MGIVILIIWCAVFFFIVLGSWRVRQHVRVPYNFQSRHRGITIIKPIAGLEMDLQHNTESFINVLKHPDDELLICIKDPTDPAYPVVQGIIKKCAVDCTIKVFTLPANDLKNPKISNMYEAYKAASNDLILISDSNVHAESFYLELLDNEFTSGMLTAIICGHGAHNLPGYMEQAYMNGFIARWLVLSHYLGHPCVLGKSMMFSKREMESWGGITHLGDWLAEDYAAARINDKAGYPSKILSYPVTQTISRYSFDSFWQRHVRWSRMRKCHRTIPYLLEPLSQCLTLGVLASCAVHNLWPEQLQNFVTIHFIGWFLSDLVIIKALGDKLSAGLFIGWCAREFLAPILWAYSLFGRTVSWRGNTIKLRWDGRISTQK